MKQSAPARFAAVWSVALFVIALLGGSTGALAQTCARDVLVSWTLPTQGTDETGATVPVAPGDLSEIRVYMDGGSVPIVTAAGDATSVTVPLVACGTHDFTATAVHNTGPESAMSNVFSLDVTNVVTPNPPTLLDATLAVLGLFCDAGALPSEFAEACQYVANR